MSNVTEKFNALVGRVVGLPVSTIVKQDAKQTDRFIEERNNFKLKLGVSDARVPFRGNPLLYMGRIIVDIDKEFDKKYKTNDYRK